MPIICCLLCKSHVRLTCGLQQTLVGFDFVDGGCHGSGIRASLLQKVFWTPQSGGLTLQDSEVKARRKPWSNPFHDD